MRTPWVVGVVVIILAIVVTLVVIFGTPHVYAMIGAKDPSSYLTSEGHAEQLRSWSGWQQTLFMTYHNKKKIPKHVWDMFAQRAKGYTVTVHDDKEAEKWLKRWYGPPVLKQFHELSGAHRADLLRFCWLYIKGGVYLDIKTVPLVHLDQIFDERPVAVDSNVSPGHIGILNGPPGSLLHGRMIDIIVRTPSVMTKTNYLVFVNNFISNAVPEAKAAGEDVLMMHEECDCNKHSEIPKDHYGFCCAIMNSKGKIVMHGRDAAYPY
jgi:hypothetical protein